MTNSNFNLHNWQLIWYAVILVLGAIGNLIVLIVLAGSKHIQKSSPFNAFLFALSLTDLGISMVGLPTYMLSTGFFKHPTGYSGDIMCKLITGGTLAFFFLDISAFLMVVIYIEQWRTIRKPFAILYPIPLWKTLLIIVLVITLNILLAVPTIYSAKFNSDNPSWGNYCTNMFNAEQNLVVYLVVFVIDTVFPISVIVIFCIKISLSLKKSQTTVGRFEGHQHHQKRTLLGQRKGTIRTLVFVVIAFLVCVVPNHIIFLLSLVNILHWNTTISQFGLLLRYTNSFINPVLYGFGSKVFRGHCKEVLICFKFAKQRVKFVHNTNEKYKRLKDYDEKSSKDIHLIKHR